MPALLGGYHGVMVAEDGRVYARLLNGKFILCENSVAPLIHDLHVFVCDKPWRVVAVRESYVAPTASKAEEVDKMFGVPAKTCEHCGRRVYSSIRHECVETIEVEARDIIAGLLSKGDKHEEES